jgi:hypothetical protein
VGLLRLARPHSRRDTMGIDSNLEQALLNFRQFVNSAMPIHFENLHVLVDGFAEKPSNPILEYVLPRALDKVLDTLVLETVQAWQMMDELLKHKRRLRLKDDDLSYRDLKRIRDKIVAHRVQVGARTGEHRQWFNEEYRELPRIKELIQKVTSRIADAVDQIEEDGLVSGLSYTVMPPRLSQEHVRALLNLPQ